MSKKEQNFNSLDSLKQVEKVINEANEALKDTKRLIVNSAIPEVLGAALGAGAGGAISFAALYTAGTVGLSAAGITSGLAAAGGLVGGGMAAGVFVLAAPVAVLAVGGYATFSYAKNKKLKQEKERLYQEALRKHDAIQNQLKKEVSSSKERIEYLNSLVILLSRAVNDLREDLASA
jgi:hypothetical protein